MTEEIRKNEGQLLAEKETREIQRELQYELELLELEKKLNQQIRTMLDRKIKSIE